MARRIIIGEILNLIKDIGGNPNKFMGTKTNINFLGKGPKESLFQGAIDIEGMVRSGFPIERVVTEAETAGGYVTAGKLNDLQLQRLRDNLTQLKQAYKPDQLANITDLGTGTKDLTQEGIASLRGSQGAAAEAGLMTRISDRMKKIQGMSDELGAIGKGEPTKEMTYTVIDPTAEKVSYASRFNPNNEVHVNKAKALLEDPLIKGVYTEAEVKNAYDFEGLYQSHFDKGHVDVAMLLEQEGHNIPQMRSAARDALLQLTKLDDAVPFAEIDIKYITEGGGAREGDPINLMVKYFGKNVTENLPKDATKESITKFTDFLMRAKDSRGRGIRDPFFDRETVEFSEFASGGRAGFKYGSRAVGKGVLAILNRNKKNAEYMFKASDNVSPGYAHGDIKYNAELLADQLAEDAGVVYDDLDDLTRIKFYGTAYDYLSNQMANILSHKRMLKDIGQQVQLSEFNVKGRKPNASGGLAKILEV